MNNFKANLTTSETVSNFTAQFMSETKVLNDCIHSINVLFGLPTHSYIIWLIVTGTGSVTLALFNLNLSVCELGNSLSSMFLIIFNFTGFLNLATLVSFLTGLSITGRSLFRCLICVERYLAVVHPVTFLKLKPLRYRAICCVFAWIITLGSCFCCMFTLNFLYIFVCIFSLQFLLFLCIQLFCLVAVLRALKQSGPGDRRREEENHMKSRAFYLILITAVSMSFTFVPFTVSGFCYILAGYFIHQLFSFGFICNVLAAFVQPVLHLHQTGKLFPVFCSP